MPTGGIGQEAIFVKLVKNFIEALKADWRLSRGNKKWYSITRYFSRKEMCYGIPKTGLFWGNGFALMFGTMNFGGVTTEEDYFLIMQKAIDGGINFFRYCECVQQWESERVTGKFLKENNLRDQDVLATKIFSRVGNLPNKGGETRYHILKACEDSLRRLETDHIDLYNAVSQLLSLVREHCDISKMYWRFSIKHWMMPTVH